MTRYELGAALYAPLRVVLFEDERGKGVFEYDKPPSLIQYLLGRSQFFLTLLLIAWTRPYSAFAHCSAASRNAASRVVSR